MSTLKKSKATFRAGSMLQQKTKQVPTTKNAIEIDLKKINLQLNLKTKLIDSKEIVLDENAIANEIKIKKQLDEKIINADSKGKFDINQTEMYNTSLTVALLLIVFTPLFSGCATVEAIFKTGMGVGIFIAVIVVVIVVAFIIRSGNKK